MENSRKSKFKIYTKKLNAGLQMKKDAVFPPNAFLEMAMESCLYFLLCNQICSFSIQLCVYFCSSPGCMHVYALGSTGWASNLHSEVAYPEVEGGSSDWKMEIFSSCCPTAFPIGKQVGEFERSGKYFSQQSPFASLHCVAKCSIFRELSVDSPFI